MAVDIPAYLDFIALPLLERLRAEAVDVPGVPGLAQARGLEAYDAVQPPEALALICEVYRSVRGELGRILDQRRIDRRFVDAVTMQAAEANVGVPFRSPDYATVIGAEDDAGRVVVGPLSGASEGPSVAVPAFLAGPQVTLFGPPDTAKLSINAMNALHRRRPGEPPLVAELVAASKQVPRWGADDEDSKTPLMPDFLAACGNLTGCFDGSLSHDDGTRRYTLADDGRSLPIKRVPGLALPDGSHLLDGNPLPLHLFDLVLHAWHHRDRPEALVFYVPKLENEDEAAYVRSLIAATEAALGLSGAIRVLVVFENPRAIFRIREIAAALGPHFLGGSLGWHDFLASTARLFRHDPGYRIPVKADPDIVVRNIRESHRILADTLGPMGALRLGGMYGVLFDAAVPRSYAVAIAGFARDVITQLRRGLDGFWVAHPDFVRIGIALVEAVARGPEVLDALLHAMIPDADELAALRRFVAAGDPPGLTPADPLYLRGVLAADLATSPVIANDDPEEVRYNVFQALQYLADWLCGNGCVALPATLVSARGDEVSVRIMDDLATTERSRWELWAEIHHGRVSVPDFERILAEEVAGLQRGDPGGGRRIAVAWGGDAAGWYPVAVRILRQLATDPDPPEFVTELLLPFTLDPVRCAADPWAAAVALCPGRYR